MLKLNLQMFGEVDDLESWRQEFLDTYEEPEVEESETEEVDETEESELEVEDTVEDGETLEDEYTDDQPEAEDDVESSEESEVEEPKKQSREENAAFAEMRRQNEALAKEAELVKQMAAQYGMTPEQFKEAYAKQQEEARAKEQGISVDVLRELETNRNEIQAMKKQAEQEKFWSSVETTKNKYGLEDDEIKAVFTYIGSEGLVNPATGLPSIDFDKAYKLVNFDKIQERKVKESNQKRLAEKKKRQKSSALGHTNASTATKTDAEEDFSVDDIEKKLKERGII
jgi:hypothetical protein